jgi:hypothetical protein
MALTTSQEVSDFCNAHKTGGLGVESSNLSAPTIESTVFTWLVSDHSLNWPIVALLAGKHDGQFARR